MAHMLEQYGEMTSFASKREPAWHGLGTVFTEDVTTREMLDLAHLSNWNVRLEEIDLPARSHKKFYATVRTNPFDSENDVLGIVGERYKVMQNEELFDFGDNILDGASWETAGSIKNGTVVFGSLALERALSLDPEGSNDKINTYLLVHTSHDGSLAVQASVTPVRVVCQNTLNIAMGKGGARQSFRIRHTSTLQGKVQAAREALGLANAYLDEFDVAANKMIQQEITDAKFTKIITSIYPKPEKDAKGSIKKWDTKIGVLNDIYFGNTCDNIRGTAWGAYNALTERLDWYRNPRNGQTESVLSAASGFDAATNAEKNSLRLKVMQLAA